MNKNLHEGHRKRLKQRFLQDGIENFEDHQILELLLFYSIPFKDTNELAHNLLKKYGSLSGVLEADPFDISTTPGIGENSAILLSLIPSISRIYFKDKCKRNIQLKNIEDAIEYIKNLFIGRTNEVFYIICLDPQLRVTYPALISEGTNKESTVYIRDVVEIVLRHQTCSVILAHNHPKGLLKPSDEDIIITKKIVNALGLISIKVNDHIIISEDGYFSFLNNNILPELEV